MSAEPCNLVPAESDTSDGDDSPPSPRLARSLPETKRPPYLPFLSELLETTSPSGLQLLGLGWRGKCSAYCRHPSHSTARACLGSLKLVFTKNQAHKGVRPSTHANNNWCEPDNTEGQELLGEAMKVKSKGQVADGYMMKRKTQNTFVSSSLYYHYLSLRMTPGGVSLLDCKNELFISCITGGCEGL